MGKITHKHKDIVNISHEKEAIPIIENIIKNFNPQLMIELGTALGGFTCVLNNIFPDIELHTFDIKKREGIKFDLFNRNVYFYFADILSQKRDVIIHLCEDKKKKLLYCDNGDKIKEVKMYSNHLNSGDMLGIHDWNKEISYSDISEQLKMFSKIKENDDIKNVGASSRFWIKK